MRETPTRFVKAHDHNRLNVNSFITDGSFALAASSLTGNTWDGCVWLFDSWKHFSETANLDLSADNCVSGISDIAWYDKEGVLIASP